MAPAFEDATKQKITVVVSPADGSATGEIVGNIIDTQGFESLTYVVQSGTTTTGDFTVVLEEGDDSALSDASTVAGADTINSDGSTGSLPVFGATADNYVFHIGDTGRQRYHRLTFDGDGDSNGNLSAIAIQGHPRANPQLEPDEFS
jgi:hypothetical protein